MLRAKQAVVKPPQQAVHRVARFRPTAPDCAFLCRKRTAELADTESRWFLSGCYPKASRGAADRTQARALGGGEDTGPHPTDRGQLGTKHQVLTEAQGIPLAATVTGANAADVTP